MEEPVIQELVTEFPNELKHSPEMDVAPHPLCSVTVKGEPDETDTDLPFKTALKTEVVDLEETFIEDVDPEVSPKKLKYSHPMDLSAQPFSSVTVKSEQEEVDIDLSFEISPKTEVDNLNQEPVIQELATENPKELKHSPQMDAPPRPLCSVTVKGEPDETDTDLPFKTALKTEVVDLEETVIQEQVPEFPKEMRSSPPADSSSIPFSSEDVKSEPEEVDTDLSFNISPGTAEEDIKTEMSDDVIVIDEDSSDGTSSDCASHSLPSSSGGVRKLPTIQNLSAWEKEVNAPYLCSWCNSRFRNRCELRNHLRSDHQIEPEDVVFICTVCDKIYQKRIDFMEHILHLHPRVNIHICPVCKETFHSCWDLHEHLSKFGDDNTFLCPRCDHMFPTRTTLERHVQIEEEQSSKIGNVKIHDRSALNKQVNTNTNIWHKSYSKLRAQPVSAPSNDNLLDCHKCEWKFATQSSLINHLRLHKLFPFTCAMCNEMFPQQCDLLGHMGTCPGVQYFSSPKSQRYFAMLYDLKRHETNHRPGRTWTVSRLPM